MKLSILVLSMMLIPTLQIQAADVAKGKRLVDKNCHSCHGSEVYTRTDRKVKNLSGLNKQVRRCELALGLKWFDDQVDDATGHLNDAFYHFK